MKISIIGSGRVGLALGLSMARAGHRVVFTDKDQIRLRKLSQGTLPFYEPHLKEIFKASRKNCQWTRHLSEICSSSVLFFTFSTAIKTNGDFDISDVLNWTKVIRDNTNTEKIIVLKSTFSPGTHKAVCQLLDKARHLQVVTCPEFLKTGQAIHDIQQPDRIVMGCRNQNTGEKLTHLYKTFSKGKILYTSPETAELGKFTCNSYLGMKISFINEMAGLASHFQANMKDLKQIIVTDSRINPHFLEAGLGFGGSCLSKDIKHLIYKGQKRGWNTPLLKAVLQVNKKQGMGFFRQIKKHFKSLQGRQLTFWGLTFKNHTDDLTNSPALGLAKKLLSEGACLKIYDPFIESRHRPSVFGPIPETAKSKPSVRFYNSAKASLKNSEALVCGSAVSADISLKEIRQHLSFIVDGRNVFRPEELQKQGFVFYQAGSPLL